MKINTTTLLTSVAAGLIVVFLARYVLPKRTEETGQ